MIINYKKQQIKFNSKMNSKSKPQNPKTPKQRNYYNKMNKITALEAYKISIILEDMTKKLTFLDLLK